MTRIRTRRSCGGGRSIVFIGPIAFSRPACPTVEPSTLPRRWNCLAKLPARLPATGRGGLTDAATRQRMDQLAEGPPSREQAKAAAAEEGATLPAAGQPQQRLCSRLRATPVRRWRLQTGRSSQRSLFLRGEDLCGPTTSAAQRMQWPARLPRWRSGPEKHLAPNELRRRRRWRRPDPHRRLMSQTASLELNGLLVAVGSLTDEDALRRLIVTHRLLTAEIERVRGDWTRGEALVCNELQKLCDAEL